MLLRGLLLGLLLIATLAEAGVADIAARLQQPAVLHGRFVQQKHMAVLAVPLVSQGAFTVVRDHGVIWQTEKPLASRLLINKDGIRGADIGDSRAMAYIGNILHAILSGDLSALEQQFEIAASSSENRWQLQLVPRSSLLKKAIMAIELQGDQHIRQLQLQEAGGDRTDIVFSAFVPADTADDGLLHEFAAGP
ncbi:MAG TPA: outer membrane lipoprotein carrier protein LolA [Pseudomonadales bacterium]